MKICKEPTLLFVNKHVYAFPKDTYPKYSFPFQKHLSLKILQKWKCYEMTVRNYKQPTHYSIKNLAQS